MVLGFINSKSYAKYMKVGFYQSENIIIYKKKKNTYTYIHE